ncbi:MAG TPA: DUF501 domain-containing protein [Candidatus Ozemobacteraceae bacterium]|nr:DUF501 domain-containing protein [Candidatus Ozemobacteraceae bacterium]
MPVRNEMPTPEEAAMVETLLGRPAKLPYRIATRCGDGTPQVLQADPVYQENGRWKPFPTFLWLVCPRLRYEVAKLEAAQEVQMFSKRLAEDAGFRERFIEGQQLLQKQRCDLAEEIAGHPLPDDVESVLSATNIVGSRSMFGVKCLHAHVAQSLSFGSNPIGDDVLARVGPCDKSMNCRQVVPPRSHGKAKR